MELENITSSNRLKLSHQKNSMASWHYRVRKTEHGGGSPTHSSESPPINPSLKKLKTKVTHQLDCLELSSCVNSKTHKERAIEALRKKAIDPNKSWDNIKNPFNRH